MTNELTNYVSPLGCARHLLALSDGWHSNASVTSTQESERATWVLLQAKLLEAVGDVHVTLHLPLTAHQEASDVPREIRWPARWTGSAYPVATEGRHRDVAAGLITELMRERAIPRSWCSDDEWHVQVHEFSTNVEFVRPTADGIAWRDSLSPHSGNDPAAVFPQFISRLEYFDGLHLDTMRPERVEQIRANNITQAPTFNTQINFNGDGFTDDDRATLHRVDTGVGELKPDTPSTTIDETTATPEGFIECCFGLFVDWDTYAVKRNTASGMKSVVIENPEQQDLFRELVDNNDGSIDQTTAHRLLPTETDRRNAKRRLSERLKTVSLTLLPRTWEIAEWDGS